MGLLQIPAQSPKSETPFCGLTVVALDTFGHRLERPSYEVFDVSSKSGMSLIPVRWRNGQSLPCGEYEVRVASDGFRTSVSRVLLGTKSTSIVVGLEIGSTGGGSLVSEWFDKGDLPADCTILTLVPLYDHSAERLRVELVAQRVHVGGLRRGSYLGFVESRHRTCLVTTFKIGTGKAVVLGVLGKNGNGE